ncbi:MAG TPA: DASS family sodium-coupled anion symporter [Vicinamibacteria bacterium]|nr:DASS family sodium-coupled anion symporter [Vicinamibacteria bacterium]
MSKGGYRRERVGLVLGPLFFAALLLLPLGEVPQPAQRMMAVAALMAIFWVSEAIPLAATSLFPLALYPLLGLGSASESSAPYANHLVFLFLGGFMLAQAMQRWGLHRRIALQIVRRVGTSPPRLVLGFMCASGFLSMWVSNTATVAMMMPIGFAVVQQAAEGVGRESNIDVRPGRFHFGVDLMLGIAYGSSIGGVATLIGTPPNVLLAGTMAETRGIEISFLEWLAFGLPLSAVFLPLTWVWLTKFAFPLEIDSIPGGGEQIEVEMRRLGPLTTPEKRLAVVFGLTAAAWTFAPVWTAWIPTGSLVTDSTIAMIAAVSLFALPAGNGERLLDWESASKLPWHVVLLFGGGFSLAAGFERSGLSTWVGEGLIAFEQAPLPIFIVVVVTLLVTLTEFASNTASAAMSIPLLAATADTMGISPLLLAIPATVAASCAFMLPAATPPNAIVFGTGYFTLPQLAKAGIGVNLLGIVLVSLFTWFVARPIFGI